MRQACLYQNACLIPSYLPRTGEKIFWEETSRAPVVCDLVNLPRAFSAGDVMCPECIIQGHPFQAASKSYHCQHPSFYLQIWTDLPTSVALLVLTGSPLALVEVACNQKSIINTFNRFSSSRKASMAAPYIESQIVLSSNLEETSNLDACQQTPLMTTMCAKGDKGEDDDQFWPLEWSEVWIVLIDESGGYIVQHNSREHLLGSD